ncbi:MAG: hypothetical protein ACHQ9S_04140 [Candidatus Binatia bacterium]
MARYSEAIYTDGIGREVFRELLVDPGCGSPTAVRQRDGIVYLLIAEGNHRSVYRKALNQEAWGVQPDWCGASTAGQRHLTN